MIIPWALNKVYPSQWFGNLQSVIDITLFNVFASIAAHGKCLEMMS